jgi:hypothetical protein
VKIRENDAERAKKMGVTSLARFPLTFRCLKIYTLTG